MKKDKLIEIEKSQEGDEKITRIHIYPFVLVPIAISILLKCFYSFVQMALVNYTLEILGIDFAINYIQSLAILIWITALEHLFRRHKNEK